MQANLHGVGREFQEFRNLLRRTLFDIAKEQDDSILIWQLIHAAANELPRLLLLQQLISACGPIRESLDMVAVRLKARQEIVDEIFGLTPLRSKTHQG